MLTEEQFYVLGIVWRARINGWVIGQVTVVEVYFRIHGRTRSYGYRLDHARLPGREGLPLVKAGSRAVAGGILLPIRRVGIDQCINAAVVGRAIVEVVGADDGRTIAQVVDGYGKGRAVRYRVFAANAEWVSN